MSRATQSRLCGTLLLLFLSVSLAWSADVSWVRDTDGDWLDLTSWDAQRLPGMTDVVSISRPDADPVITLENGSSIVDQLISDEALQILNASLTVHKPSHIEAPFVMRQANVSSIGELARIVATQEIHATDIEMEALDGGEVRLALSDAEFTGQAGFLDWSARGRGSSLVLGELTELNGSSMQDCLCGLQISTSAGGLFAADRLTTLMGGAVRSSVIIVDVRDAGSRIQLPALTFAQGTSFRLGRNGALSIPNLAVLHNGEIRVDGNDLTVPAVVDADTILEVTGGGSLDLPNLQVIDGFPGSVLSWRSVDPGSRLNLSALRAVTGNHEPMSISATNGGHVDLSQLQNVDATLSVRLTVDGVGSVVDLSSIDSTQGFDRIRVADGGTLRWSDPTELRTAGLILHGDVNVSADQFRLIEDGWISVERHDLTLPTLTSVVRSSLNARESARLIAPEMREAHSVRFYAEGGELMLPVLTEAQASSFVASNNGLLDASALRRLQLAGSGRIAAEGGASVNLSVLESIERSQGEYLDLISNGPRSRVDLSSLSDMSAFRSIRIVDGGEVRTAEIRALDGVSVELLDADFPSLSSVESLRYGSILVQTNDLSLSSLTSLSDAALVVREGASLSIPNVAAYMSVRDANRPRHWNAHGAGSVLEFERLAEMDLSQESIVVGAEAGGRVDLSRLRHVTAGERQGLWIEVEDVGSVVDISSLRDFSGVTRIQVRRGGSVVWANPTQLEDLSINLGEDAELSLHQLESFHNGGLGISGKSLELPNLTSFDGSSLGIAGGSLVSLPALLTYRMFAHQSSSWSVDGDESTFLDVSQIQVVRLGERGGLDVTTRGGEIDLSGLTEVSRPDDSRAVFKLRARGEGHLRLPNLARMEGGVLMPESGLITLTPETLRLVESSVVAHYSESERLRVGTIEMGPRTELVGHGQLDGNYVNREGIVSPGRDSLRVNFDGDFRGEPGELSIRGDLTLIGGQTLIDVNGTHPGDEVDHIRVLGTARLGGRLTLVPRSEFQPELGNQFSPLSAADVHGQFDGVDGVDLPNTPFGFAVTYDDTRVLVRTSIVGDVDFDDDFDDHDFQLIYRNGNYESGVVGDSEWITGDWNGDTRFDSADLVYAFQKGTYAYEDRSVRMVAEPVMQPFYCVVVVVLYRLRQKR